MTEALSGSAGAARSVGGLKLYTAARHASEPSVHPGMGLRGSGCEWGPCGERLTGLGQSAASMRRLAIMMPELYSRGYSESDEEVVSSKMGAGGGRGGKLYIAARVAMLGDIFVVCVGEQASKEDCESTEDELVESDSEPRAVKELWGTGGRGRDWRWGS